MTQWTERHPTSTDLSDHPGLLAMLSEMGRQCSDALQTLDAVKPAAERIADQIRSKRKIILFGMGGSHHVNCIVEPLYRDTGFSCRSVIASEALFSGLVDQGSTAIMTSQSGESGEIVELLNGLFANEYKAAITLDPNSTLARASNDVLLGHGGPELAFAATRSIILTLAMHAAILSALGAEQKGFREVLSEDTPSDISGVADLIGSSKALIFAGRHTMHGVASSAALSMMELSRLPTIGFESGQFKHGPFEMLSQDVGVVLLRGVGLHSEGVLEMAAACREAGSPTVVFDASGRRGVEAKSTDIGASSELAAATQFLLTLQRLNIEIALKRVAGPVGTPLHTTKITR